MISAFTFTMPPTIVFGNGKTAELPKLIQVFGKNVLLITGKSSYRSTRHWDTLQKHFKEAGINHFQAMISGEPSPEIIDEVSFAYRGQSINVVVAWGGGSVIDAGKAISAMLPQAGSVLDYMEDVGNKVHNGKKLPFIAIPTTAGTGSEASKNAVISRIGQNGFKKSLRHDNLVPNVALIDPELAISCPSDVTAACGMDAFTQLLESYVSNGATPLTDALAWSGLCMLSKALIPVCADSAGDTEARGKMAYAALMSGITLANAGLGVVHGLAAPIGGFFDIPHGVVCGTLVGAATEATIEKLFREGGNNHQALRKYAQVGALLTGTEEKSVDAGCVLLVDKLHEWTTLLQLPRLAQFGVAESDMAKIVSITGNKNNPIKLTADEIYAILIKRI